MNQPRELLQELPVKDSLSRLRVLLVDDNHEFLELATQWFSRYPWIDVVGRAYYGQAALALITHLQPDLVLMDVAMPGMTGLETTLRMKQLPRAPRIVMLTLHDIAIYRTYAQQAGADGFVAKSAFNTEMLRAIGSLFPSLIVKPDDGSACNGAPAPSL